MTMTKRQVSRRKTQLCGRAALLTPAAERVAYGADFSHEETDYLYLLSEMEAIRGTLAGMIRIAAELGHDAGYTWDSIGDALGMTRQAAWERFAAEAVKA